MSVRFMSEMLEFLPATISANLISSSPQGISTVPPTYYISKQRGEWPLHKKSILFARILYCLEYLWLAYHIK